MNRKILSVLLILMLMVSMLTACGKKEADPVPDPAPQEDSVPEDQSPEEPQEPVKPADPVTIRFDTKAYEDPGSDEVFCALAYATSTSEKPVEVSVRYSAYDAEGNVIKVFDRFGNKYREKFETSLFVPAGAADMPVSFRLADGFGYNYETDEEMPEIDHLEIETLSMQEDSHKDLSSHFTPGDPQTDDYNLRILVKFDQDIADNYEMVYADYTILAYKDGQITAAYSRQGFPYGDSFSVSYGVENHDGSILLYHDIYGLNADEYKLYLGCINCDK